MRTAPVLLVLAAAPLWTACSRDPAGTVLTEQDRPFALQLPPGAPPPPIPADEPLTEAGVALGKALFFEPRLSMGNGISCASCHRPDKAFSDTVALSIGAHGRTGFRNAPSLANAAYLPLYLRDGGAPTLPLQVLVPVQDEREMDADIVAAAAALRDVQPYRSLAMKAYDRALDTYVITRALASYERTLISGWSRFDRYIHAHDATALSASELNGWALFNAPEVGCSNCHSGFDLSDHGFYNIGLSLDHAADPGRERITLDPADRGSFKVPTLRNIALTAPYMHDGSLATLEEVIDHFASGGVDDPNKSPLMHAFPLNAQQRADLVALLNSFTDERNLDQVP
ncbi:MAG: cytochrome c peroxidase [Flavobacteriales bacterium]